MSFASPGRPQTVPADLEASPLTDAEVFCEESLRALRNEDAIPTRTEAWGSQPRLRSTVGPPAAGSVPPVSRMVRVGSGPLGWRPAGHLEVNGSRARMSSTGGIPLNQTFPRPGAADHWPQVEASPSRIHQVPLPAMWGTTSRFDPGL